MKTYTKKYSDFVHNHEQRPINQNHVKNLIESMRLYGFLESKPIQCYRHNGKLVVVDGHHRLEAAMALGIEVCVVIESAESQDTMPAVNSIVKKWEAKDFVRLYASRGNHNYIALLEYEQMGIPISMAASMMINNAASSGNAHYQLIDGTFKIKTLEIIEEVYHLIYEFAEQCPAIRSRPFIGAISKCIMCKEFNMITFKSRLAENTSMIKKTNNEDQMLTLIESVYNHRSRNQIPLKFYVDSATRERNAKYIKKSAS